MNEQLKPRQEEDGKDSLEISHFEHIRSKCIKLGAEAVLIVAIIGVGVGLIKGVNKIKPFFNKTDEKTVSIDTLPQATISEKPKSNASEYVPPCYTDEEYNTFIKSDFADLPPKDNTEIDLELNIKSSQLDNMPVGKPDYAKDVVRSIVRVVTDNGNTRTLGSGFVTEDKDHNKRVVTVAHVVTGDINKMHIETIDGKSVKVEGGCRIYGSFEDSQYKNIPLGGAPEVFEPFDIAVLTVADSDSLPASLPLSETQPKKGEVLYSMNNQVRANGSYTTASEISGFGMIFGRKVIGYMDVIDGLTDKKHMELSDHTEDGGSGGPTFSYYSNGEVIGVAIGSEKKGLYLDRKTLKEEYNMTISESAAKKIKPVLSTYSDTATIKRAILSPALNNQLN